MRQSILSTSRATFAVATVVVICGIFAFAGASRSADAAEQTGAQLFLSLCASCHGAQGRGDGPVAPLLVYAPPDLTRISQRHSGFFPAADVLRIIDGRSGRAVHGTRNMPVWGRQLYYSDKSDDAAARAYADKQITLLSEYIRSIQQ